MRLENTDRFRNKYVKVVWKSGEKEEGEVVSIPNSSAKYNYHKPGWFLRTEDDEIELIFRDILRMEVFENGRYMDLKFSNSDSYTQDERVIKEVFNIIKYAEELGEETEDAVLKRYIQRSAYVRIKKLFDNEGLIKYED